MSRGPWVTESPGETLPAWMSGRSPLAARSAHAAQRKSGGKGPSVWGAQAAARGPQSKKAPGTHGQEWGRIPSRGLGNKWRSCWRELRGCSSGRRWRVGAPRAEFEVTGWHPGGNPQQLRDVGTGGSVAEVCAQKWQRNLSAHESPHGKGAESRPRSGGPQRGQAGHEKGGEVAAWVAPGPHRPRVTEPWGKRHPEVCGLEAASGLPLPHLFFAGEQLWMSISCPQTDLLTL